MLLALVPPLIITILIKRISKAPIYRTGWEHRVHYNRTSNTHTHTHTHAHTHARTHTHAHTHTHTRTHARTHARTHTHTHTHTVTHTHSHWRGKNGEDTSVINTLSGKGTKQTTTIKSNILILVISNSRYYRLSSCAIQIRIRSVNHHTGS